MTYNEAQDAYIFCDASDKGFVGHLTTGSEDEPLEMFGSWSLDEQVQSSTWREFGAVKRVSTHFSTGFSLNIFYLLKCAKRIRHKLNKLMKSSPIYNKLQHYLIEHACI